MRNDEVRHQEPALTAGTPDATGDRRFEIPVSTEVLRKLQGALCIRCGIPGGRLYPDGRAVTVSPDDSSPISWDVRAHSKCMERTQ
ncbi:hypothetical protein ACFUTY_19870 [Streptomyces sp. NPDC057362]|uniref:hypothetical protein n=1 Tax=Streptomyces sp. NPDC057362 TaxID=3346106 RepID=UPI00362B8312